MSQPAKILALKIACLVLMGLLGLLAIEFGEKATGTLLLGAVAMAFPLVLGVKINGDKGPGK